MVGAGRGGAGRRGRDGQLQQCLGGSASAPYHWQSSTTFDGSEANVEKFSAFIDEAPGVHLAGALAGCASRACSVVAAYLMRKLLWGVEQMLEYMRVKRHDLNPTLPARRQLFDVQRRLEARYAGDERIVTRLTNASWALPSAKPTSRSNGSGSACVVSDGSGVTTTNNDISANNDSIRVEAGPGVLAQA